MKTKLNKIAKDTNFFLKKFIKKQDNSKLIPAMKYGLFPGGKKIRSKILIETEEEFDGIKKFYTSRKMIVAKFFENGNPTTLSQDIQKGKKYRVKIITQKFGNGKEDYDIAKS